MKSASLSELSIQPGQLEALIAEGDSIRLIKDGKVLAILTPLQQATSGPIHWPDFEAQRKAVFGDRVLPAGTIQAIMDEERGDY